MAKTLFAVTDCFGVTNLHQFSVEMELTCPSQPPAKLMIESETAIAGILDFLPLGQAVRIDRLEILSSGSLVLTFGERSVAIGPDRDYEAWTLTLASGELFVANPSGGVTHFAKG